MAGALPDLVVFLGNALGSTVRMSSPQRRRPAPASTRPQITEIVSAHDNLGIAGYERIPCRNGQLSTMGWTLRRSVRCSSATATTRTITV